MTLEQMNEKVEKYQTEAQDLSMIIKINEKPLTDFLQNSRNPW